MTTILVVLAYELFTQLTIMHSFDLSVYKSFLLWKYYCHLITTTVMANVPSGKWMLVAFFVTILFIEMGKKYIMLNQYILLLLFQTWMHQSL